MTKTEPPRLLFTDAQLFGPVNVWEPGWLLTEGRHIHLLGPGQPPPFPPGFITRHIDCAGTSLLPGFIDLHFHGALGHEAMDATPQALHIMAQFAAQHGVTAFLPSSWTASRAATNAMLAAVDSLIGPQPDGATIVGAHLEGPYLNPAKCGAQDPQFIRRADREEAEEWLATGVVRLLAVAPEYPENAWLIEECVRRGVTVTAAHTAATYEQMVHAVALGVRQATHSYNAMLPLGHREPGTVGAILTLPEINCELIADNIHVHPAAMRVLAAAKGPAGVILVTDAVRPAGLPDGEYPFAGRTIHVRDGAVRLPDGTLAGSTLTLDRALHNILVATRWPLREAWPMSSLNAARAIGLAATKGSLEVGKDADLVLLDADLQVRLTVAEGTIVYEAASTSGQP
jgi:N-acetylglucosamine-6-phosphate deacetylase